MSKPDSGITKITRPRLSGIFRRKRLFTLLDQGRTKPVTWIGAPAGSGKTTLVASWLDARKLPCLWYQVDVGDGDLASFFYYMGLAAETAAPRHKKPLPLLTPEYLQSIPVFTRRYFEELFRRLRHSAVIVFDNYQDAPPDSGFHELMAHAIETVPDGCRVVIVSRSDPPPQFARLAANNKVQHLGWDHVRLTREESGHLLKTQGQGKADEKTAALLHAKTEGWAAGLVLLSAGTNLEGLEEAAPRTTDVGKVFDYFASQIFDKTEASVRELLLRTAFLSRIDRAVAEELTGNRSAGLILERLSRDHYFTYRQKQSGDVYQYHPLFREFLLNRAQSTFSRADLSALQQKSAELLADAACIEDAIELLRDAGAWERLSRLVEAHAPRLLAEGRNKTVEAWLRAMPRELLRQNPWALFWLGACCLPFDQIEARSHYEAAYRLFKEAGDAAGRYLAWAGIADSFIYQWDDFSGMKPWLEELERLQREHSRFPSVQVEARVILGACTALYYTDSNNPLIGLWSRRIETLMRELPDPNFKCQAAGNLMLYSLWYGAIADQRRIAHYIFPFRDHPAATPLSRILVRHALACPDWMSGENDHARALCEEGLRIAEQSGVHVMDLFLLAYQVYSHGCYHADTAAMGPLLDRMSACLNPQRGLDVAHFHHLMAWYLSLRGCHDEALVHCSVAFDAAKRSGAVSPTAFALINTAQILILAGRPVEAEPHLARAEEIIERHGCVLARYESSFVRAALALRRGNGGERERAVRRMFELAVRLGHLSYTFPHPEILRAVCAYALREGIESDYTVSMIRRSCLQPPADAPENWPWPVSITTLDRFEVLKDGKPLLFAGKRKQRELLKALICLGGSSIREEQVTELLWPDAEGDDAHNSFKMTLSRLRAMIGNDALIHEEGCYSLNPSVVRVDAWAFERRCRKALDLWEQGRGSKDGITEAAGATGEALALYQGVFLPDDAGSAWTVSMRERLRSKLLRLLTGACRHYEEKGKWKTAAAYYEKGLHADPLREEFYQRLMMCHHKLGQAADAVAVYNRCCSELSSFGIKPSSATEELYCSIRR